MNAKAFLTTALGQALELGIGTPDDVLRHAVPELLASRLPRPVWSRLLAACLGSPSVDARLVVETVGIANLVEHLPEQSVWACVAEIGARALDGIAAAGSLEPSTSPRPSAAPKAESKPILAPPPPEEPKRTVAPPPPPPGPSIPSSVRSSSPGIPLTAAGDREPIEERPSHSPPSRGRTPTSQRFRQSNTGIGRLAVTSAPVAVLSTPNTPNTPSTPTANTVRRPQAQAGAPALEAEPASVRRGATESEAVEFETQVGADDWKSSLAVDDEQLVDWTAADDSPGRR